MSRNPADEQDRTRTRIGHMLEATEAALQFVEGITRDEFLADL